MAMKPEFKKVWVDALRSGEFKQGKKALRRADDSYCCLGVGCAVWSKAGLVSGEWGRPRADGFWFFDAEGDRRYGDLPRSIRDAAGLDEEVGTLVTLNDLRGNSFAEIADYIEANL